MLVLLSSDDSDRSITTHKHAKRCRDGGHARDLLERKLMCFVVLFLLLAPVMRSMLVPNGVACGVEGNSRKGFINFQIFMEFLLIVISR